MPGDYGYEVPPSLERWAELSERVIEAQNMGLDEYAEELGEEAEAAWFEAPLRDRLLVDWRSLLQAIRESRKR